MGYTHYWTPTKDVTDATWNRFVGLAREVITKTIADGTEIAGPLGEGPPEIEGNRIAFNGPEHDDLGHETCEIERGGAWTFCKTAQKPYDVAVVALLAIGETLGILTASSDGNSSEWEDGLALARGFLPETRLPKEVG